MKLFVIIATIDNRIEKVLDLLLPPNEQVVYIVSHQVTSTLSGKSIACIEEIKKRKDAIYDRLMEKGVSVNRNNCFRFVKNNSICFICDDDVELCNDAFEKIIRSFEKHNDSHLISYKIKNSNTLKDFKSYPKSEQKHTIRTLSGIGAIEMAFKSEVVLKYGMRFDPCFGPGNRKYPTGEDYIFAMDLYKRGFSLYFEPIVVASHPSESTGVNWSKEVVYGKGAVFARVFGVFSIPIALLFSFKKYMKYKHKITFVSFAFWITRGALNYLLDGKNRCQNLH